MFNKYIYKDIELFQWDTRTILNGYLLNYNMAQKERNDKLINKAKVTKEYLKDPLASQRTIAKRAGVANWTVARNAKELEQTGAKVKAIEDIIATDATIVQLAQMEIQRRLQLAPEKEKTRDIISAADTSAKRHALFKWDATDKEGWLKAIHEINITIWN